jgi:hypothetical protein
LHRRGVSGGKGLSPHFLDLLLQFTDSRFRHRFPQPAAYPVFHKRR